MIILAKKFLIPTIFIIFTETFGKKWNWSNADIFTVKTQQNIWIIEFLFLKRSI